MKENEIDLTRSKEPSGTRLCIVQKIHDPYYVVLETCLPGSPVVTLDLSLFSLYSTPTFQEGDVLKFHYKEYILTKIEVL